MRSALIGVLALLSTFGMSANAIAKPTPEAEAYFGTALQLLKENHINTAEANWRELEARARVELGDATTSAETYAAIRLLIDGLGEKHSFLMPPRSPAAVAGPSPSPASTAPPAPALPTWQVIDKKFGLIRLPALDTMGGGREATGPLYAAKLRSALLEMDAQPLCGWIIDLRDNSGGNMWPMLQGLDPLLGESPFGFFIGKGESLTPWIRTPNGIFPFAGPVPPSKSAFELRHSYAPLAVLIGPKTASSGEMVAIAFSGRSGVRIFGQSSAGYATGNAVHPLSDGAFLVITEVTVKDRASHPYRGPIIPDEAVEPLKTEEAAAHWLAAQCSK